MLEGFISDDSVHSDIAYGVVIKAMENMEGQNFWKFKAGEKIHGQYSKESKKVKVRSKRLQSTLKTCLIEYCVIVVHSPNKLKEYLSYRCRSFKMSFVKMSTLGKLLNNLNNNEILTSFCKTTDFSTT